MAVDLFLVGTIFISLQYQCRLRSPHILLYNDNKAFLPRGQSSRSVTLSTILCLVQRPRKWSQIFAQVISLYCGSPLINHRDKFALFSLLPLRRYSPLWALVSLIRAFQQSLSCACIHRAVTFKVLRSCNTSSSHLNIGLAFHPTFPNVCIVYTNESVSLKS